MSPALKAPGSRVDGKTSTSLVCRTVRCLPFPAAEAVSGNPLATSVAETSAKAKGDTNKTREALKNGKWDGIMGPVDFNDYNGYTNQNNHQMLVEQIQSGKHETVFPLNFAPKKPVYPFPGWNAAVAASGKK